MLVVENLQFVLMPVGNNPLAINSVHFIAFRYGIEVFLKNKTGHVLYIMVYPGISNKAYTYVSLLDVLIQYITCTNTLN